ncbi:plasmid replication/partition related protein [Xanthomonas sp. AM6]|uniref:plasmid replication/partition related protein n=1 Tax=Xanthomonas sp. AM6 TaxID=2982531 RepID=UPI0021DAB162|nr:plasmid replication/partition related protein [Xanthomonas sp. AM6]UYB53821.1 plasmid replication/partition related protein [Xanthomonas sp. AM6]
MNIVVNEDLKAYIDPLTADEYAALERSLLAEGCRDALVLWGEILVDGHNRYGICQKHGLPFQTVQNTRFQSLQDVHLWMIDQHLGRRSVSDFQRGVLALRKREILAARRSRVAAPTAATADGTEAAATDAHDDAAPWADAPATAGDAGAHGEAAPAPLSRAELARAARLSNSQVVQIEKIQKQATAEVVEAVKSGAISINAAAAVASLPEEEQRAAARAGKDELRQAAKRAREAKRKPRETPAADADGNGDAAQGGAELAALRLRVAELDAENQALREEVAALRARLRD